MCSLINRKLCTTLAKSVQQKKAPISLLSVLSNSNFSKTFTKNMSSSIHGASCKCALCSKSLPHPTTCQCSKCSSQQIRKHSTGERHIFYGHKEEPMFAMERDVELPKLGEGEVLVKVRAATICISDIHTVTGARIEPTPSVLGHEACVEIIAHKRDPAVFTLKPGDRATFSIADTCGECEFCTNHLSQKCVKLFKYGHATMSNGTGFNGSYATHVILRKGTEIIKLPDVISDDLGASINCALGTMVNCVSQIPDTNKKVGSKAMIQGDGMLGLYGCALLKTMGFDEIYCTYHHKNRIDLIKKFGAIPISNDELKEKKELTNKIDTVIEVCGSPKVVPEAMRVLKPGGSYIFAGMVHPDSKLEITGEQIIRKCLTIRGVHNYEAVHLRKSVEFLEKTINEFPYDELVAAKHYSLDDLTEAIEMAKMKVYPRICVLP